MLQNWICFVLFYLILFVSCGGLDLALLIDVLFSFVYFCSKFC